MGNIKGLDYWDTRYASGGNSGEGSIGDNRRWKWEVIEKHVELVDDVIDVGCGDLSFWEERDCSKYVGIDISPTIIAKNTLKRPHWQFIVANAADLQPIKSRIVFCFDILFHIMEDDTYEAILDNIIQYSQEWALIYTWKTNPINSLDGRIIAGLTQLKAGHLNNFFRILAGSTTDFRYQKYREFKDSLPLFVSAGFRLIAEYNDSPNPWGAMYVLRRDQIIKQ